MWLQKTFKYVWEKCKDETHIRISLLQHMLLYKDFFVVVANRKPTPNWLKKRKFIASYKIAMFPSLEKSWLCTWIQGLKWCCQDPGVSVFPLGWPLSHIVISCHWRPRVTSVKYSSLSQNPNHSRDLGKSSHCLSHLPVLETITVGRRKAVFWLVTQGHVRLDPYKPPSLTEEEGFWFAEE